MNALGVMEKSTPRHFNKVPTRRKVIRAHATVATLFVNLEGKPFLIWERRYKQRGIGFPL